MTRCPPPLLESVCGNLLRVIVIQQVSDIYEKPSLDWVMVDSMATFWIVSSRSHLWQVTNEKPGFHVETANGWVPVEAVGIALVYLRVGDRWECFEVPNVFLLYVQHA